MYYNKDKAVLRLYVPTQHIKKYWIGIIPTYNGILKAIPYIKRDINNALAKIEPVMFISINISIWTQSTYMMQYNNYKYCKRYGFKCVHEIKGISISIWEKKMNLCDNLVERVVKSPIPTYLINKCHCIREMFNLVKTHYDFKWYPFSSYSLASDYKHVCNIQKKIRISRNDHRIFLFKSKIDIIANLLNYLIPSYYLCHKIAKYSHFKKYMYTIFLDSNTHFGYNYHENVIRESRLPIYILLPQYNEESEYQSLSRWYKNSNKELLLKKFRQPSTLRSRILKAKHFKRV